jgi:trans-aconitate methyltransferase
MFKPLIFLDIDGVLNSETWFWTNPYRRDVSVFEKRFDQLDPKACKLLHDFCQDISAQVVISSTWRKLLTVNEISSLLEKRDCYLDIIGATPHVYLQPHQRGDEIQSWLDINGLRPFVIFDDDSDMGNLKHRLVQTSWQTGLTQEHIDRAYKVLTFAG